MEIGVLASFLLAIFAFTSTTVLFLMLRFPIDKKITQPQNKLNLHSSFLGSISPLKRNIFTYLDKLFIRIAFLRVVVLVRYFCIEEDRALIKKFLSAVWEFLCPAEFRPPVPCPLPDHLHDHRMVDGHDSLHHHPHQWMQTLPRPLCKIRHILDQQILPSHILPSGKFISKDPLIHDVKSIIPFLSESQTAYFQSSKHLSLSSSTANTIQQHEPRDRVQSYVASDSTWECPLLCRQRFLHF